MASAILFFGGITSIIFVTIVLLSHKYAPEVLLSEMTNASIETPKDGITHYAVLTSTIVTMFLGSFGISVWAVATLNVNFGTCFLLAYVIHFIVNLADFIIVDVLFYMWIYPKWIRHDNVEVIHDYWTHTEASLTGLLIGLPIAAMSAGTALFIYL